MPNSPDFPGVFVDGAPSGEGAIVGATTSTASFIGVAAQGPLNHPVQCLSFSDFVKSFSDDSTKSDLARYVKLFYANGGETCFVVRVAGGGVEGKPPKSSDYSTAFEVISDGAHDGEFNLLVLPPAEQVDVAQLWGPASVFCQKQRALLLMDAPVWSDVATATTAVDALRIGLVTDCSALYFPRLTILEDGLAQEVGPTGAIAGLIARSDRKRGRWKTAGGDAFLLETSGVEQSFSDHETDALNAKAINTVRVLPNGGIVCWGARTMAGASDAPVSQYKYVPVRRLSFYIEDSVLRALNWAVFEPNDEQLWSRIRRVVGTFMHGLWAQGALQGTKPEHAFFARCDATTTTQQDRDNGRVNIVVGFAPLQPNQFIELLLTQVGHP